jgi:hypothetical protein
MSFTAETQPASRTSLLDGYLTEDEISREAKKSKRTLREERLKGVGAPFIRWGKTVLYPRDGFLAWLKSIEQKPRRTAARRTRSEAQN